MTYTAVLIPPICLRCARSDTVEGTGSTPPPPTLHPDPRCEFLVLVIMAGFVLRCLCPQRPRASLAGAQVGRGGQGVRLGPAGAVAFDQAGEGGDVVVPDGSLERLVISLT